MNTQSYLRTHETDSMDDSTNLVMSVKESDFNFGHNKEDSIKLELIKYKNQCQELKNLLFSYENREKSNQTQMESLSDQVFQTTRLTEKLFESYETISTSQNAGINELLNLSSSSTFKISEPDEEIEQFLKAESESFPLEILLKNIKEINKKLKEIYEKS